MGCASSKRIEATTAAVYQPPPTSFAVFDINAIEEPWIKHLNNNTIVEDTKKPTQLPPPILHKLNNMLDATEAPQSWDEVSRALQDLKPIVQQQQPQPISSTSPPPPQPPRKVASFHTLEELDAKLTSPKPNSPAPNKTNRNIIKSQQQPPPPMEDDDVAGGGGGGRVIKPVKENIFIVRDRMERQKGETEANYEKRVRWERDPLSHYPEMCPPGGGEAVVIYTTSLGGVRKTFEECNRARDLLEGHRVVFDERDVALHGEFLKEIKELVGEVALPRVFVKGRYLGGLEELVELNETGRLGRMLNATRVVRGAGRLGCGGCGGARFVPCLDCGGSCKVVLADAPDKLQRCPKCNENGLVHCPACLYLT